VLDDLFSEVNVEVRPKKVTPPRLFDLQNRRDGSILEPGKLLIGEKQLLIPR
jgi:hypothetical protein